MFILSILLSFFLHFGAAGVVSQADSVETIFAALDRGSSSDLAEYFDSSIQLNVNGQQGNYSKNQAEQVLKEFFKKNPPTSFSVVYKSENSTSLSSYVGDYQSNGGSYKVFLKVIDQKQQVRLYSLEFVSA
ncbi:DUF4783 domain-containing protein [Algoriphagus namhaensis]|uniref:DUF4783 domain-containing protein n=1 Tax=Algoriphagus namhaensis TaxID=915353 RepID=A0ABV8APU9_9BACT